MGIFRKKTPKEADKNNNSVTNNIGKPQKEPRKCPVCGITTFHDLGTGTVLHNEDWRVNVRLTHEIQYHKKWACSRCGTEID